MVVGVSNSYYPIQTFFIDVGCEEVSVELLLDLLATVGGLGGLATVIGIAHWLGKKFTEIDYRFRLVDERFKAIDERFEDLKNYIDSRINRLATAFTDYQEFKQIYTYN